MTPAARLQATLDILQELDDTPRPADALVSAYFRSRRYIGSKDRAEVSTRVYAMIRHQSRLDWWLSTNNVLQTPRLRLLAWMSLGEKLKLKSIGEMCSGERFAAEPLEEEERVFLRKIEGGTIEHPHMPEEVLAECPAEVAPALKEKFGANFMREMRAMQRPATLDIRINPLKTDRETILATLQQLELRAKLCPLSPWGIRVFERPSLATLPMLKDGLVEVQDEGSQLVALAVDAKPGERIVDFCAGAGGKTLAMAASMHNKGKIIACDVMEKRLKRSAERFRRAGVHNIEARVLSSERDPWVKKHKGTFDRVLVDAPCSGTGTWRRNPDARWRIYGMGMEKLLHTQAEILDSAARLVKAGGRLVYATCSLLPAENEAQIDAFLKTHPEYTVQPCGLNGATYLSLSPAEHDTDGFFAAVLTKAKAETKAETKPDEETTAD